MRSLNRFDEMLQHTFSSPEELLPPLLDYCKAVVSKYRPRLDPEDIPRLVESDMAVLRRDVRALRALTTLRNALLEFEEETSAPSNLSERSSVFRSEHSKAMARIQPEVRALSHSLLRAMTRTISTAEGTPASLDDKRLWQPRRLCVHEAVIIRFTLVRDESARAREPWEDGRAVSEKFLAAVSFLAGTRPCFQAPGCTVQDVMDREITAINMLVMRMNRRTKMRAAL